MGVVLDGHIIFPQYGGLAGACSPEMFLEI